MWLAPSALYLKTNCVLYIRGTKIGDTRPKASPRTCGQDSTTKPGLVKQLLEQVTHQMNWHINQKRLQSYKLQPRRTSLVLQCQRSIQSLKTTCDAGGDTTSDRLFRQHIVVIYVSRNSLHCNPENHIWYTDSNKVSNHHVGSEPTPGQPWGPSLIGHRFEIGYI